MYDVALEPPMVVWTCPLSDGLAVKLSGCLDLAVRDQLKSAFVPLIEATTATIDLTDVTYADTTLLNEVIRLVRDRRSVGNDIAPRIVGLRAHIRRIFEMTNVDRLVHFHASMQDDVIAGAPQNLRSQGFAMLTVASAG